MPWKTPGILPSLCSASPWRAAKRPCLTKLGMDISPGWNSTVQRNNGVLHVFLSIESMENLGVETVGETWGWFQLRPLLKYMYIYIIIYIIYIFRRRGPIPPQSYQFVGQKYSPFRKCCWKMIRISGAVLKSDQPSCLDYGQASHKPIGRRTSPADLSSGGPPTKKQHVRSKILPLSCRCVHKIHALHTSLSVKHQIFCFRYEDFLATTPYLYVCGYPLVN